MQVALLAVFFLSGAAALVYEVVWMRDLALIFGATTPAVATTLSVFMGGLALGSHLFGRLADRVRHPLRTYALLELGIAAYALLLPTLLEGLRPIYVELWRLELGYLPLILLRACLAGAVLLPPTVLMGGTFPVLARLLVQLRGEVGRSTGLLYFSNTAGAVAGTLLAGFVLIESFGLLTTSRIAALANVSLAGLATVLGRWLVPPPLTAAAARASGPANLTPGRIRIVLLAIALSGMTSLAAEVLWTRALLRHLYNSTYAFSTMLAVFLAGIAIGSWLYSLFPVRRRAALFTFALLELCVAGAWVVSALLFADLDGIARLAVGGEVNSFAEALARMVVGSALVLLLPAILLGAAVPLATELCVGGLAAAGRGIGRVYAINTVGAIIGSLSVPFLWIPTFGMLGTLRLIVCVNLGVGSMLILAAIPETRRRVAAVAAVAAGLATAWLAIPGDLFIRHFGTRGEIVFYREGATDTVAVVEDGGGQRVILYEDMRGTAATSTYPFNFLLGHLPLLLHPGEPRTALHICFGVGNSLSAMAAHESIERVDSVELSPHVIEAADYFWTNAGVASHPKVRMITDDGRNFAMASDDTYDVIELEPPEIFTAGVIHLYTREFYEDAAALLAPDGIMLQWVPVGEATMEDEKRLFRAFFDVFPHATIWQHLATDGPVLFIGSKRRLEIDYEAVREKMARPFVRDDLALSGVRDVDELLSMFVFGEETLGEFVHGVEAVTDDRTVLDFSMPRFLGSGFGLGSFNLDVRRGANSPYSVWSRRGRYYHGRRESVVPYLVNYGDRDPEALAARILGRPRPTFWKVSPPIHRDAWRRWESSDGGS